jgi:hypothetical protein
VRTKPIAGVILHSTETNGTLTALTNYAIGPQSHVCQQGCPTLNYSYVVDKKAMAYRCVGEHYVTYHCTGKNETMLGVALNYVSTNPSGHTLYKPEDKQLEQAEKLIAYLLYKYDLKPKDVHFHREFNEHKTCPGSLVDKAKVVANVTNYLNQLILKAQGAA